MIKMKMTEATALHKKIKKPGAVTLLLIAGLLGIFLIGIAPMLGGSKEKQSEEASPAVMTAEEYAAKLEAKLVNILEKIDGVGEVTVMVTLKNGYSYRYAVTEKKDSNVTEDVRGEEERKTEEQSTIEQAYVLIEGASGSEPLIMATSEPEVRGVVVVCDGGGDPIIITEVTEAVKVALDLSSAKITVSKRCTVGK